MSSSSSSSSNDNACEIVDLVENLVISYEDARTKCGTVDCQTAAGEVIPPEDLATLCGDGSGLLQEVHDKGYELVIRTGAVADVSYPDPGPPKDCEELTGWLIAKAEYFEHLHCYQCPEYKDMLQPDYYTQYFTPSTVFLTRGTVRWTKKIELWEYGYDGVPPVWHWKRWTGPITITETGTWHTTSNIYGGFTKVNDWTLWKWRLYNDHCCIDTPVYHQMLVSPPPYIPPPPSYRFNYANESEYSLNAEVDSLTIPLSAFSNGTAVKKMTINFDTHTAADQAILQWRDPTMGTLLNTGYVLGPHTFEVTMPDISTVVPGGNTLKFVENGDSWHSGWEITATVTDVP